MATLDETQRRFTNYVLRDLGQTLAAEGIKGNGLDAKQRLSIYRNNTQLGLTEALRDGYPVVNKLVGAEFFNHLARSYIRLYPPKAGCLLFFGGQFADFIADFQPAANLPYLPDVARLEWLWHEVFHEAEATTLEIATLSKIDPDSYSGLGFVLHPTARFLRSDYPVLRIWQANQVDYDSNEQISLDEGGCWLLVYRPALEVEIIALNEAEYLFLSLLGMKLTLTQAVEQVITKDSTFDVLTALQRGFDYGLFTDIYFNH